MEKYELSRPVLNRKEQKSRLFPASWCGGIILSAVFILLGVWQYFGLPVGNTRSLTPEIKDDTNSPQLVRNYELTIGARWLNLDGGRWRPMFVCNGKSPCPTLTAEEGDEIDLHVVNDLYAQLSIHWSGMSHRKFGFWNDGTGGLNQYPILPRGNWTSKFDTTGHWGMNWYADHTGAGVADGVYGTVYVAPSASRPRPYSMITSSATELGHIKLAEKQIQHLVLWNSDFRTVDWKFNKMKGTGAMSDLYCYKSILVNGKGRVFCKDPDFSTIDNVPLDDAGCLIQAGFKGHTCKPSTADLEVIETNGQRYLMMNLINVGFEHALKFSIDDHQMWIVATDAGFTEPRRTNVVYITNGSRMTVLVKLDQPAKDYAMRLASTSKLQNLEGMSILRYPSNHYPLLGFPMELPKVDNNTKICLNPDSSVPAHCTEMDQLSVQPWPKNRPPKHADKTLLWTAGSRESKYEKHVTEYFVNEEPWQLFRAALKPVLFTADAGQAEKPVQGGLPLGTVVDIVVQNTLNETIPMYKHGSATWHLGSQAYQKFKGDSVDKALKHGLNLNVHDPPMALVHDLPPLGWLALRWKVDFKGATMFHAVKLRYFALGMAAPLLEGIEGSMLDEIPEYALSNPHVVFEPKNDGVFG